MDFARQPKQFWLPPQDLTHRALTITGNGHVALWEYLWGANVGLGRQSALKIGRRGGKVHLHCRNDDKAKKSERDLSIISYNMHIYGHTD